MPTYITATPYPLQANLSVSSYSPAVGDTEIFTLTVTNPAGGVTVGLLNGSLQINNGQFLAPSPAAYLNVAPGTNVTFTYSHVVTSGDSCTLTPIAAVTGEINPHAPSPIQLTPVYLTPDVPIAVQRLGVSATISSAPPYTSLGSSIGTQVVVTNTGCINEFILGALRVNGNITTDLVTQNSGIITAIDAYVVPGNQIALYSNHTVSAQDVNAGIQVPISYAISAVFGGVSGLSAVTSSNTVNVSLQSSVTGTPGASSSNGTVTLSKLASEASAHSGDTITFTITMTNGGTGPLSNVTLSDNLASTLTYVSSAVDIGAATNTAGNITAAVGTIPAGGAAHLTIVAKVNSGVTAPGLITNTATGSFAGAQPLTVTVSIPVATGKGGGGLLPVTGYGPPPTQSQISIALLAAVGLILGLMGAGAYFVTRHVR